MAMHPIMKAAIAAGTVGGTGLGFMVEGERLEAEGVPTNQQIAGGLGNGVKDGFMGAGIGLGVSGTGLALAKILGK